MTWLGAYVPAMLRAAVADEVLPLSRGASELGILPAAQVRQIVAKTVNQVIWPGLRNFGISPSP